MVSYNEIGFPILFERNMPLVFSAKASVELARQNGQVVAKTKLIPTINGKMQAVMGTVSPVSSKFIGSGVLLSLHSSIPVQAEGLVNTVGGLAELTLKTPTGLPQKEMQTVHVYVEPFTVRKPFLTIMPINKAEDIK